MALHVGEKCRIDRLKTQCCVTSDKSYSYTQGLYGFNERACEVYSIVAFVDNTQALALSDLDRGIRRKSDVNWPVRLVISRR